MVVLSGFKTIQEALSLEEFSDRPVMNKAFVHEFMDGMLNYCVKSLLIRYKILDACYTRIKKKII